MMVSAISTMPTVHAMDPGQMSDPAAVGSSFSFTVDTADAEAVIDVLGAAAEHCRTERYRTHSTVRLPKRGRLLATGDLHDNPYHFDAVIRAASLDLSSDHHLLLHELIHGENLINGLDLSYRMLVRVAELKNRYPDQVHPILANHELAQMTGRSISKGAGDNRLLFDGGLAYVFGEEDDAPRVREALNAFMRSWPLAVVTESGVLCAHSLPRDAMLPKFDAGILERDLHEEDYDSGTGSAYLMVWGRNHTDRTLDTLAERWKVSTFILGHAFAESGYEPLGRRGIILNSDHERGAVLPIDLTATPDRDQWLWSVRPISSLIRY